MINVTKPFFPPKEEYFSYLESVWANGWMTNNGPLVNKLEQELKSYLRVDNLLFLSNGTLALQIAIKALNLKGSIITTPFSYVATTSSIVWEGCKPIFIDIDPLTFNLNPQNIESAITTDTSAILATHVYGNPCDIEGIQEIAIKYNLKVIYDAAHCFGTLYKGESVFSYGDVSTTSFHATKLFHTVEGGAVFTKDSEVHKRMQYMRNFGHDGFDKFNGIGINAKNSEFHAAMGLLNLKYIQRILKRRRDIYFYYNKVLVALNLQQPKINQDSEYNYSYYPIVFPTEEVLLQVMQELNSKNIFPRRYFFPSLHELDYVDSNAPLPISKDISSRILCLPAYFELDNASIDRIAEIINNVLK